MTFPYYPPTNPEFPSRSMTPEWFVEKERLLSLPGAEVRTPQGEVWDCKAVWNGGEGGPPQGSVIVLPPYDRQLTSIQTGTAACFTQAFTREPDNG